MVVKEIAWTIGGSDCSSGRGIQTDLKAMTGLSVHGCTVVTAIKAGNTLSTSVVEAVSVPALRAQLHSLADDLAAKATKIGYLASTKQIQTIVEFFEANKPHFLIYDPDFSELPSAEVPTYTPDLLTTGSGSETLGALAQSPLDEFMRAIREQLLPTCHLLTVDLQEALTLLAIPADQCPVFEDRGALDIFVEEIGLKLVAMGPKAVVIKGGERKGSFCQDYFTNGMTGLWLNSLKRTTQSILGTGDTLSAAIAAAIASGHNILDSLVIAKSYVNQTLDQAPHIGRGTGPLGHGGWTSEQSTLPWLTLTAEEGRHRLTFKPANNIGFYPIVDSAEMVAQMVSSGVKHVQLRLKGLGATALAEQIEEAARICRQAGAELFVNDYSDLAIKYGAQGVHLGQADLVSADLSRVAEAGLKLGITAKSYWEMARALAFKPSYITVGPIFNDDAPDQEAHQGLSQLIRWRKVLDFPIVAAGGIVYENAPGVLATGIDSIAVYRDLSNHADLPLRLEKWLRLFERRGVPSGIDRSFDASVKFDNERPRILHNASSDSPQSEGLNAV